MHEKAGMGDSASGSSTEKELKRLKVYVTEEQSLAVCLENETIAIETANKPKRRSLEWSPREEECQQNLTKLVC